MWTGNLAILFLLLPLVEPASLHIDDSSSEWMFLNTSSSWNSTLDSSSAHSTSIGDSQGYLHFCGSSVSVYGIIQPPPAKGKSGQNVTFWFADNEQQPTSVFNPSPSPQNITEYDVLLYEQTGLNEDVYRTLWFRMGSTTKSLTYLNYAIVNSTDGVKNACMSKTKINFGAIIGGALGGLVALSLAWALVCHFRRAGKCENTQGLYRVNGDEGLRTKRKKRNMWDSMAETAERAEKDRVQQEEFDRFRQIEDQRMERETWERQEREDREREERERQTYTYGSNGW